MPRLSIVVAAGAGARLEAARGFLASCPPATEAFVVAASRDAADELVRAWSRDRGTTFGLHRFSFLQFAMRVASLELARAGLAPATRLGAEAVAARAAFEAVAEASLDYLGPVAGFRGFVRALAATLDDVRRGGVAPTALDALSASGRDLALLARRFDTELSDARLADRATLLGIAARAIADGTAGVPVARPLLLLDVAIDSAVDATFVAALAAVVPRGLATVPVGDERTLAALTAIAGTPPVVVHEDDGDRDLARLRRRLFAIDEAPGSRRQPSGAARAQGPEPSMVSFFSAPGEGREAIEIARRVLEEARRGVRFDEMAVVLRAPGVYAGLVETALGRAGVPAWFARGTSTPHPAGRAFLAVLTCAAEGLSARRFAEYLSLGQVPMPGPAGAPVPVEPPWVPADADEQPLPDAASAAATPTPLGQLSLFDVPAPAPPQAPGSIPRQAQDGLSSSSLDVARDDAERVEGSKAGLQASGRSGGLPADSAKARSPEPRALDDADDVPVIEGTLRAPWKWERLLVESAVIGGGRERWVRRLNGLASELDAHRRELAREEPDSPHVMRVERDLRDLEHLRRFALPVVDALVALPERAVWGTWLDLLDRLAPQVLKRPERVLSILAELRPMASVGPVTLEEVQHVLVERLSVVREEPPRHRYGRVFVGTPDQLRGRHFKVLFVPGLAERIFPQRSRQDPLLLDEARLELAGRARALSHTPSAAVLPEALRLTPEAWLALPTRDDRASGERALLRLLAGAATERLWLSYPRMELTQSRPRVPSFYALDVARALTGRVPDYRELEDQAYLEAEARLAWPAPPDPARAIDDTEHDLSVLGRLLRVDTPAAPKGRARYLLELNPALRRSLLFRFARWQKKWSASDGLYKPGRAALAALARHRPGAKAYSVSALQKFATCPYQFLLSAVHRLEPRKDIAPLEKMDPLTRGSIFHQVQAELMRVLKKRGTLPVTTATLREAERQLDGVLDRIAADARDELAPAIGRVWRDEVESMRGDLRGWLQRVSDEGGAWTPLYAEWGFGFPPAEGRDPASMPDPVVLDGRWKLHGFVDLIEGRARDSTAPGSSRARGSAEHAEASLRVTDHKTGKARAPEGFVVGGGEVLQPVLYGMAVEQALGRPVLAGRLFYCTSTGAYTERTVTLGPMERRHGLAVIEIVDRAVEQGFLPPVPRAGACEWCDFREVCGPDEERRSVRKPSVPPLEELKVLRELP